MRTVCRGSWSTWLGPGGVGRCSGAPPVMRRADASGEQLRGAVAALIKLSSAGPQPYVYMPSQNRPHWRPPKREKMRCNVDHPKCKVWDRIGRTGVQSCFSNLTKWPP